MAAALGVTTTLPLPGCRGGLHHDPHFRATHPRWAERFDRDVARAFEQHDGAFLARVIETDEGRMSHPGIDHFLPMLYVAGAAGDSDPVRFPVSGFDLGSLSMRSVLLG